MRLRLSSQARPLVISSLLRISIFRQSRVSLMWLGGLVGRRSMSGFVKDVVAWVSSRSLVGRVFSVLALSTLIVCLREPMMRLLVSCIIGRFERTLLSCERYLHRLSLFAFIVMCLLCLVPLYVMLCYTASRSSWIAVELSASTCWNDKSCQRSFIPSCEKGENESFSDCQTPAHLNSIDYKWHKTRFTASIVHCTPHFVTVLQALIYEQSVNCTEYK